MSEKAITIDNLEKHYGNFTAVHDISFWVKKGSSFAFLGKNGAGKSTTINIICTLLQKSNGQVKIFDYELGKHDAKIKEVLGIVFQENILDSLLTVRENLITRGSLYIKDRAQLEERLQFVVNTLEITDYLDRPFGKLSGGQQRRAEIARALMNNPQILILDEPTTGLDPNTRKKVWDIINMLKETLQMTIFLTTHYMEEAAHADWIEIIDNGRIIANGTPNYLKKTYASDTLRLVTPELTEIARDLEGQGYKLKIVADILHIEVADSLVAYNILQQYEGRYTSFEAIHGTVDDVFVNVANDANTNIAKEEGL